MSGMGRLGREALIDGVLELLAEDTTASMGQLAAELGVGRTTLYRHFGDRETLVAEVARRGARMFVDAFMGARPKEGDGLDAVERVCRQLFTVPDVLTLLFADNPIITDDHFAEAERRRPADGATASADPLEQIIARGQTDGTITGEVPVEWAAAYVFLTIGSGHLYSIATGAIDEGGRARALELTIRAVVKTLGV